MTSLLSVIGKIYGNVLVRRMKELTSKGMDEEHGGFREGRGCVDQVFILRLITEKLREKNKIAMYVFWIWKKHMIELTSSFYFKC